MYNWNLKIHPQYGFSELDSSFDVWGLTAIADADYEQVKTNNLSTKLEQGCVYLILCFNPQTEKYAVYTGQTKRSFKERFNTHKSQGKFKSYVIKKMFIFTSAKLFRSIDNLIYFEYKFMQFVNHLSLDNINKQLSDYDFSNFSPEDNPEHDECFAKMKLLLQFLEISFKDYISECKSTLFVCKGKRKNGGFFEGNGFFLQQGNKFLVLKESYTDVTNFSFDNSWLKGGKRMLKRLLNTGIIVQKNNFYVFQKDHLFASPSGAASFLCVKDTNGWTAWKELKFGGTLDQICRNN